MPQEPVYRNGIPERTPEQAADEAAFGQVNETIVNIEHAVRRAEKAHKKLVRQGTHPGHIKAIETAIAELKATRKKLTQSTYFAVEDPASYDQRPLFEVPDSEPEQTTLEVG